MDLAAEAARNAPFRTLDNFEGGARSSSTAPDPPRPSAKRLSNAPSVASSSFQSSGGRPASKRDYFHIADHSYGHLALLFPRDRVGGLLPRYRRLPSAPAGARRASLTSRRCPEARCCEGYGIARIVFHSTSSVREKYLRYRLVPASRLVQAAVGHSRRNFSARLRREQCSLRTCCTSARALPRKNIELFAADLRQRPPTRSGTPASADWRSLDHATTRLYRTRTARLTDPTKDRHFPQRGWRDCTPTPRSLSSLAWRRVSAFG